MHLRQAEIDHHSRSYFFLYIWYGVFWVQRNLSVLRTNDVQIFIVRF